MGKRLNDLSQLTKAMIRPPEVQPKPTPKVVEQEDVRQRQEDADAAAVLAYFSRSPQKASRSPRVAPRGDAAAGRSVSPEAVLKAKDAALAALAEEKAYPPTAKQSPEGAATRGEADERIAELERQLAEEREAHEAAIRERDRLQGDCGRLQGELRKRGENAPVAAPVCIDDEGFLFVKMPVAFRTISGKKKICVTATSSPSVPPKDLAQGAILKAIAKSLAWMKMIDEGKVTSVSDLATKVDLERHYVVHTLRLATLSPRIIRAALKGDLPDGFSLEKVRKVETDDWAEQEKLLGFKEVG